MSIDGNEGSAALAAAQFGAVSGSDADFLGHFSVWRGDPDPDRPQTRAEFERHMASCDACRDYETTGGLPR